MTAAGDWLDWARENQELFWWLGALSIATLVASAFVLPVVLARIPEDYFVPKRRPFKLIEHRHPVLWLWEMILKNVFGLVLVVAGVVMLFVPGQGLLTILIGLFLMNFPGKYRLERWIISRKPVLKAVNWIRAKARKPPLVRPGASR